LVNRAWGSMSTAALHMRAARKRSPARRAVPRVGLGALLRNADMTFNRLLREELSRHDVSFSQFQHLWQLWQSDGLAQVELSRRIGIETASSTAVIEQLEKRGLIARARDAQDRRRINVTLTPAGRALQRPLTECAAAVNTLARRGLTQAQVAMLFDVVETIIGNLREGRIG
jgi:MarR family transcriptional regulator, organic hydroperoxide resistance regulator